MFWGRFWASWRFLGGKQRSGGGQAGRDLQVTVIWMFSLVLMEGLGQGWKRWERVFSWVDVVLVGETAFLNAQKVMCTWRLEEGCKKVLPSSQQRNTETPFFGVWFWVLQWCRSASLEWKSELFFLRKLVSTLWRVLIGSSSWNRPRGLFPQVRTKRYLIKRWFKLRENFCMKNYGFHWVTQWLLRKIFSSSTRIDGQAYNCRVLFPAQIAKRGYKESLSGDFLQYLKSLYSGVWFLWQSSGRWLESCFYVTVINAGLGLLWRVNALLVAVVVISAGLAVLWRVDALLVAIV